MFIVLTFWLDESANQFLLCCSSLENENNIVTFLNTQVVTNLYWAKWRDFNDYCNHNEWHKVLRPSSDPELFMSQTEFEFGATQINKSMPVDSDVELNSANLIQFEPKLLVKYFIIIYALGSAHEGFGVWIKAVPKAKFPAERGGKNGWAIPNSNSRS